jgi:hypothetical protein
MKLKQLTNPIFIIALSLIAFSCDQQKTKRQGTIEEVDGVTIVKNPVEPMYGEDTLELEEDLSIGEAEGRDEYVFSQVKSVAVDGLDNIYVLDSKEAHIKVFDKVGQYLTTIGKKGQAPDEFQGPRDLTITPQNEILVNDIRAKQLKFLDLKGIQLRQISHAKYFSFSKPQVDTHSEIIARVSVIGEKGIFTQHIKKFTVELDEKFEVATVETAKYPEINPFFPQPYWVVNKKDQIIWGVPVKYELHVVNPDGTLFKTIRKEYNPVPILKEEKEKVIEDTFGGEQGIAPDVKIVWNEHHNAFKHLSIDGQGRIFVQTYEMDDESGRHYYDVFDSEGKYISRILLNSQPLVWKNDKLYTIEEDEEGYQYVKRYKVTWNY